MIDEMKRPDSILVERDARDIVTVTLNRPEIHNAFDDILIHDLIVLFKTLAQEDTARMVVITGQGKTFSAGGDLNWMRRAAAQTEHENFQDAMQLANMLEALNTLPMPTIAKVNGIAMGGGTGIIASCDIAIAVDTAKFAFSEARLGLVAGTISPYIIAAIGAKQARRYFLTAERFDAEEARRIGLLHEVAGDDELDAVIDRTIGEILKSGPMATRGSKALVASVAGKEIDDEVKRDSAQRIAAARASDEGREGVGAFLEKRKPAWITGDGA